VIRTGEKVESNTTVEADAKTDEDADIDDAIGGDDDANAEADRTDAAGADANEQAGQPDSAPLHRDRRIRWSALMAYAVLPGLALLLALVAGYLKWQEGAAREAHTARVQSVQEAKDATAALLSYRPDTVEKDLGAAEGRLTGDFRNSYASLIHDVVIPGAKQKQISAVATIPAAASVSATGNHAVVLVFVNQTVTVGAEAPTATASAVRVTLDKTAGRWLISAFDPV
jgi:Mce-associated membrane protein